MSLLPPNSLQTKEMLDAFLSTSFNRFLQTKAIGDTIDPEHAKSLASALLAYVTSTENLNVAFQREIPDPETVPTNSDTSADDPLPAPSTKNTTPALTAFSSVGKVLSSRTTITHLKGARIIPYLDETSTALSVLNSPEAASYITNHNKDLDIENETILHMDNVVQKYSLAEDEMITNALGLLSGMKMEGAIPFKDFKTTLSTTRYLKGFYNSNKGDIYTLANFTIRGDHSQVAARVSNYYYYSQNLAFGNPKEQSIVDQQFLEIPNQHSAVLCQVYNFPSPLTNREAICNLCWKRISEKSIVVTYHPMTSHEKVEVKDGDSVIRASFHGAYLITQLDDGTTEVTWGVHLNFGGHLPKPLVHSFIIPNLNRVLSSFQAYFASYLTLSKCTVEDGKLLGEILVNQITAARKRGGWKKRAELGEVGVDEFLYISVAMRELLPLYPWFRSLLHEISLNHVKVVPTVTTALADMKDNDAINLAKGLSTIILANTEAGSAVDHWIAQNDALVDFKKEHPWMRPFFVQLAQYNLSTSNLGLRLRVFGGAVLSVIDLVTDIYMTVQFFNTDSQQGYGKINAVLIGLTIFIQILVAYAQNSKKLTHFLPDTACILTGFKPALDAYRVGSGVEKEEYQFLTPLAEMTVCKCTEFVFEAVPSSVVQIFALLLAKEKKLDALISIPVSAATIAFSSSMISYDFDTSPDKRHKNPAFYGYVPDKAISRAVCFFSLMAFTYAHVLLLTFSCALLAIMNPLYLIYFLSIDMALFFIFKIATRDFFYFVNLRGFVRFIVSLLMRFCAKIMANFTLMIQFLFSALLSVVASVIAVYAYSTHYNPDDDSEKLDDTTLKITLASLYSVWLISAIFFIFSIKREYLQTFYSLDTTNEYDRKFWSRLRKDQDAEKAGVLRDHPNCYAGWGDELLKPWTLQNWDRWEEERPAWFTDAWVECVPNEFIPFDWRVKYKKTKGRVECQKTMFKRAASFKKHH
ncbi:hypothetical protein TL16_g08911 [Triparma laevis f. inornata]|uniref:START domain-containing protein n=1 Tax=Triparma laevis f. inornata TaxID=1714386 RepID=A0A9W7EJK8_9STRA|nr:hypothetical protein TL16_g08911 [Triparma laevis f. inornata]